MRFTLSWLKEHLRTEARLDEITWALTDLGLEIEGVEDPAATLGAFRIARVVEAGPHPDADRLRVCRVETFPDGPESAAQEVQVVCGAPNARTGLVGVFAPPGTHVPGTGVDLKPGVIRGVESNGMLCSERELMLSDEHDGVIDLPEDAPLGARYIDYVGANDPVIEIAVTPNRADALGVAGIARDLAARGLGEVITPEVKPVAGSFACPVSVTLDASVAAGACPHFVGRLIRGVKNGPSPKWLQQRLRAIGLRPISALVDVTNFLTFDRARPLHVFDAARVRGGLLVRAAREGETLAALNDETYALRDGMTVIADENGPEALGGIMGGARSGVNDATTEVFIEAAWFDPTRTAATGRALKINSDARYRFERGVDPASARWGMELATRMILDLCGGEASEIVEAGAASDNSRRIHLRVGRAAQLVGMEIAPDAQRAALEALGFAVTEAGEGFDVAPPSWRMDVHGEADLVEEVARIASLTRLQSQPMSRPREGVLKPVLTPFQQRLRKARRALAANGLNECVTYSFIAGEAAAALGGGGAEMALENPISSEMSHMRPSPLPGLALAAARNLARGAEGAALFEIGPAFDGPEPGQQQEVAASLRAGVTAPRDWTGARRVADLWDVRADAEAALHAAGAPVDKLQLSRVIPDWLHPGRAGALMLGPKTRLALFGELHPRAAVALGLKGPVAVSMAFLEAIPPAKAKGAARPALTLNPLQPVERDFAFLATSETEAEQILRAARGADKKLIADAEIFDIFEGGALPEGQKSVAIWVRMQPSGQSMTDEEIDAVSAKVVAAVSKATGAQLRGAG